MKTYAEVKDVAAFNWKEFLSRAIVLDYGEVDVRDELLRATSWVTCACGNQCDVIPRDADGAPIDVILKQLGMYFTDLIYDREWLQAKDALEAIELRSAELIAQIEARP